MLWFKLLKLHRASLRDRLRFTVRHFSRWLVLRPSTYCVIGLIDEAFGEEFFARFEYFYGSIEGAVFHVRRPDGWRRYRVAEKRLKDDGASGLITATFAALFGKILVYDYNSRWQRLDALFRYKVFIVNWKRDFRTSSWRFCASMARRPLARLEKAFNRPDGRIRQREVAVLGNGPSAYKIFEPEFADMDVVVCNTAIKSSRLLAERKVVALCFTDATFFIGPSAYSQAFYQALNEAVALGDFSVYLDFEQVEFVLSRVPNLTDDRIFPVLLDGGLDVLPNFKQGLAESTSHSVSTSMMFPCAATYYRRIHLVGFDGKDPKLTNYFWKHGDEFQFNDLLPTVRASDPGFFSGIDYVKFAAHGDSLTDRFLSTIEASGVEVRMSHPSFIEPLARRYKGADAVGTAC